MFILSLHHEHIWIWIWIQDKYGKSIMHYRAHYAFQDPNLKIPPCSGLTFLFGLKLGSAHLDIKTQNTIHNLLNKILSCPVRMNTWLKEAQWTSSTYFFKGNVTTAHVDFVGCSLSHKDTLNTWTLLHSFIHSLLQLYDASSPDCLVTGDNCFAFS